MTLHTENLKPIARAPLAAPAAAVTPWAAFEAPTAEGTVRLCVHDSVRHAADAALALQSCAGGRRMTRCVKAFSSACSSAPSSNGFSSSVTAPFCIACTASGTSAWPLM